MSRDRASDDDLPPPDAGMPDDLVPIRDAYAGAINAHGPSHSGVGYSSRTAQMLRLRVLLRLLSDSPEAATRTPVSVHDLGCGYGALWPLLDEMETPPISAYWGWDITRTMIRASRALHGGEPRAHFMVGACPDAVADYGFVSGTFNFRARISLPEWRDYVAASLTTFAGYCRKGMAFNLLDVRAPKQGEAMFYNRPEDWRPFAEALVAARGGGRVVLATDYLPDDFTLFLWFDQAP